MNNKRKRGILISGFPGVGKTYLYQNNSKYLISDSDSSKFSWKYVNGEKTNERNPDFPSNYIEHLLKELDNNDVVFCNAHKEIRDALKENNIPYIMVYPDLSLKKEYIRMYSKRSTGLNDYNFVNLMESNYDTWIKQLENEITNINRDSGCVVKFKLISTHPHLTLEALEYLLTFNCAYMKVGE